MKTHRLLAFATALLPTAHRPRPPGSFFGICNLGFGIFLGFGILGFGISGALPAQLAPITTGTTPSSGVTPITTGTGAGGDEVVELSPFTVTGEKDTGYQAMSTASGSRIRTDLRDTAAAISPFTEEFLNDIGATTIDDLLAYAGNTELDYGDDGQGFGGGAHRGTGSPNTSFRIRGLAAGVSVNFVNATIPVDNYNTARAEMASGANSILFGIGNQGGMINFTTKRADTRRNLLRIKNTVGTWNSPTVSGIPYYRAEFDYNLVLMPKVLGVRLLALYEDGNKNATGALGSWRKGNTSRNRRINPVVSIRPLKNTTIHLGYEVGYLKQVAGYNWNILDSYTGWADGGSIIQQTFNTAAVAGPPGTRQFANTTNFTLAENDASGSPTLYNYRRAYYTDNRYRAIATTPNNLWNHILLPENEASFYYGYGGPGTFRTHKFNTGNIVIEQRLGDFNFELAWYYTRTKITAHLPDNPRPYLQADPNALVSSCAWDGLNNVGPNPNVNRFYIEDFWRRQENSPRNDTLRLTTEYSRNLKKLGRHRVMGLLERKMTQTRSNGLQEILLDENQVAISDPDPSATTNLVTRRQYVTLGDYTTYYPGDWQVPLKPFVMNGHEYRTAYVTIGQGSPTHSRSSSSSLALALQSHWLNDSLVTLLGVRYDDYSSSRKTPIQITDPDDPRVRAKTLALNEWTLAPEWNQWTNSRNYTPWTYTAGAVWRLPILSQRLSLFANYSTNSSLSSNARVLTEDGFAPVTEGRTTDYGVMFDFLGDGKIFLRLTRFDSRRLNESGITHNSSTNPTGSSMPGSMNIYYIYNALYYLNPTPPAPGAPGTGPMTTDMYRAMPLYTQGLLNLYSKGYEAELTANITKSFTMRLTFSYSDRDRYGVLQEIFNYFNAHIAGWMDMAGDYRMNVTDQPVKQYIRDQLFGPYGDGGARADLAGELTNQTGPLASRPYKFNILAKYTFRKNVLNGLLNGLAVSAGARYNSPPKMPDPARIPLTYPPPSDDPTTLEMNPDDYQGGRGTIKGKSLLFYDLMFSYRCKLLGGRTNLTLQLNINNIFNNDVITVGRTSIYGPMQRVYLNPPRSFFLSATFDF